MTTSVHKPSSTSNGDARAVHASAAAEGEAVVVDQSLTAADLVRLSRLAAEMGGLVKVRR